MRLRKPAGAKRNPRPARAGEHGWALLGLLLALGVMSIVISSSIVPNVQMQVQRDKELEMMYRGQQMAEGIARYYGRGRVAPLQIPLLLANPLTELDKLREGVTIGVREIKFVRPSAMIDPMISSDWEPVRVRDPRILKFLQAWAAQTLIPIPNSYLDIARVPQKSAFEDAPLPSLTPPSPPGPGQTPPIINPANPGNRQVTPPGQRPPVDPEGDGDDNDDDINDPLGRFFESGSGVPGQSNAPIVGVAPRRKGKAATAYFGLENYEDWIFIYVPKVVQPPNLGQPRGPGGIQNRPPPQVSQ